MKHSFLFNSLKRLPIIARRRPFAACFRMKRIIGMACGVLLLPVIALHAETVVEIKTSAGTMTVKLYDDVPNHVRTFVNRAKQGQFNGTLFTRVIPGFMIQGGSPDSKNAAAGARVGFGDRNSEILPEFSITRFHKKGVLAAPRQDVSINPKKQSDMSQFFIVQGKVYRPGELDTLELAANQKIRKKALDEFYYPVKTTMDSLKSVDKKLFNRRITEINAQIDSVIRATPGHLIFTPEQREAYTTLGGCPHLDGQYTVFGELTEGFEALDAIAGQPVDAYDRPKKDIRILSVQIIP
ncbi:MAG: peptidylprolyl isomerase [Tannerella sp.]|jgi:cyclophilin family peptidyl-prolyl cis-trans isomerase|nr:peptidylprolyl isomerase [Tannerella sp.]